MINCCIIILVIIFIYFLCNYCMSEYKKKGYFDTIPIFDPTQYTNQTYHLREIEPVILQRAK